MDCLSLASRLNKNHTAAIATIGLLLLGFQLSVGRPIATGESRNAGVAPWNPFSPAHQRTRTLGKLVQAAQTCKIYAEPSVKAKVYSTVNHFDYMVAKEMSKTWTEILLQNGDFGYVLKEKIMSLPYLVSSSVLRTPAPGLSAKGSVAVAHFASSLLGVHIGKKLRGGGFVSQVFADMGDHLPTSVRKQSKIGNPVDRLEKLKPGDRLYFWDDQRDRLGFAGIFLGNGVFVGPLPGHDTITTDYLGNKKWLKSLVAARR